MVPLKDRHRFVEERIEVQKLKRIMKSVYEKQIRDVNTLALDHLNAIKLRKDMSECVADIVTVGLRLPYVVDPIKTNQPFIIEIVQRQQLQLEQCKNRLRLTINFKNYLRVQISKKEIHLRSKPEFLDYWRGKFAKAARIYITAWSDGGYALRLFE
jgi:hypothetical protein